MSVLIITSLGNLVVDLHTDLCPLTSKNFLKLCKMKYYHNCLFHTVQKDFIVQTGDPTGTGSGGDSIYKFLYGDQARFFDDEIHSKLKHDKVGVLAMASAGENMNASQFYLTTRAGIDFLDGKHTVFGEVAEGHDTLIRINEAFVDEKGRPYKNIRIKHTYVLDDPFDDPAQLAELIPERSPELKQQTEGEDVRLEEDWVPMDEKQDPEELEKSLRSKEAHSRAVVLEMIGDIPEAEIKPPENVLFVCKLNPVTQEEDLEIIFSRFGKVLSADIIKDYKTGDSLCYGFIEFETQEACEAAYFKMDNVLIDDRRIHVDFSQSVAKLWTRFRRFGTKDTAHQEGSGCFKCGESGHHAKDCPNESPKEKDTSQQKPKYVLKDAEKQHGDAKYKMVFEGDDESNFHDRGSEDYKNFENDRRKTASKRPRDNEDTAYDRNAHKSSYSSREARKDIYKDSKERRFVIEERRHDNFNRNERHARNKVGADYQKQRGRGNEETRDYQKQRGRDNEEMRDYQKQRGRDNEEMRDYQKQRGRDNEEIRDSRYRRHGQEKSEGEGRHAYDDEYKRVDSRGSSRDHERRDRRHDRHITKESSEKEDTHRNERYTKNHRDRHG